ncbi:hypothetical protein EMCG_05640, partial [[Emmonsia] crescens]
NPPSSPQSPKTPPPPARRKRPPRPKSKLQSHYPNQICPPRTHRRSTRSRPWYPTAYRPCTPC